MNTLKEVPHLGAIDHAIEVLRASFDHPEADEAIAGLRLLREQAAWAHHTPALLSGADAAADLAGEVRPGAEPFGYITVKRVQHHADRYEFFPAGQAPYLDNVDECHAVYTTPPQASQPVARPGAEPVAWVESVMHEVQVLASTWALVGSRFDDGTCLDDFERQKTELRAILYTKPQASQPEAALAAQPGAVGEIPTVCDGKEQEAFEKWAAHNRFNLSEHPLHYLFLDPKTDAARQAWKGALEYVGRVLAAAPTEAKPAQASQPLTDEQWNRVSRAALEAFFECSRGSVTSQIDCAAHAAMRATEKAHGIGAAQKDRP